MIGQAKKILKLLLQVVCDILATNLIELVNRFAEELHELQFFVRVFFHNRIDYRLAWWAGQLFNL